MRKYLILGGLLCLSAGLASASIIPTFTTETGSASLFTFDYSVSLDSLQTLITGNELCFTNVAGLTGAPTAPTGWTATDETSGCPINAGTTVPNVGPSVLYTYTASTTVVGAATLGTFTFQSTDGGQGLVGYGAVAQKTSNGLITANQGDAVGPAVVPEPTTWLLLFSGIAATAAVKRRLRRS
jgi:hypothetical protein